jgi:hypothetical protein
VSTILLLHSLWSRSVRRIADVHRLGSMETAASTTSAGDKDSVSLSPPQQSAARTVHYEKDSVLSQWLEERPRQQSHWIRKNKNGRLSVRSGRLSVRSGLRSFPPRGRQRGLRLRGKRSCRTETYRFEQRVDFYSSLHSRCTWHKLPWRPNSKDLNIHIPSPNYGWSDKKTVFTSIIMWNLIIWGC